MRLALLGAGTASTPALLDGAGALGAEVRIVLDSEEVALLEEPVAAAILDLDAPELTGPRAVDRLRLLSRAGVPAIAVGSSLSRSGVCDLFAAGVRDVIGAPLHKRELILRLSALLQRKLRIACLGGGTGLYTVLSALKDVPRVLLSSIVTMSDDGGSSGLLRASFGVLPPGDVRRSLVALSNAPEVMSYVMQYRFANGEGLRGHSLGNLLLTALSELAGGMQGAVKALGDVLNVHGIVMCVTEHSTTLCAELEDGRIIRGEHAIDVCLERPSGLRIDRVWQEPDAETSVDVYASLLGADLIVIGPGDLYTSVLSGLVVGGVAEAIRASNARRLYVCNLMTKPGETTDYDVGDHVSAIVSALGADVLDYVLTSCTDLEPEAERTYAEKGQHRVAQSPPARLARITRAELIAADIGHRAQLVRHDGARLRDELVRVLRRSAPSILAPTPLPISSARALADMRGKRDHS